MHEATGQQSRKSPLARYALLAAVLAVFVFLVFQASKTPGTTSKGDGYIGQRISSSSGGKTASFRLALKEGDVEHESAHVFGALASVPGVATARIVTAGPSLEVAYDPSAVSEDTIRKALAEAGYAGAPGTEQP